MAAELEPEAARLARNLRELGDAGLEDPGSWDPELTPEEHERAKAAMGALGEATGAIAVSVGTKIQAKEPPTTTRIGQPCVIPLT